MKKIVTFNDIAALAGCTLGVLLPVLTAGGCKVYPVPTAAFTSSTRVEGYKAASLDDYLEMVKTHWSGLDFDVDCVLTGCAGSAKGVEIINDIVKGLQSRRALCVVDPVMGDDGKLFVAADQVGALRELVKCADVTCPNMTEFCALLGLDYARAVSLDYSAQKDILDRYVGTLGVEKVVVTGIRHDDLVSNYVYDQGRVEVITHPYYHGSVCGTGDMFAGVMTLRLLKGDRLVESVRFASHWIMEMVQTPVDHPEYGLPLTPEALSKLA